MSEQPNSPAERNNAHAPAAHQRRRWKRGLLIAVVTCVALCVLGGVLLPWWLRQENLRVTLRLGRLADLPTGAHDVRIDGSSSLFSSCYYLRFQAPADAIEAFVAASPGLRGLVAEQFTPAHMYLPSENSSTGIRRDGHRYFHYPDASGCPWFDPTIRVKGRRFEIPQDANANYGEVIINDETQTVYIWVAHS